jgi:prolipoprotein diacylglyceryl transferase
LGARLGHCFFYDPEYYLSNPLKILAVWEGGLASHGAAFGILFGLWLYARQKADQSYLWVVDRIVIVVALGGCFIRLGNLMNSEIVGSPTDLPWAFVFHNAGSLAPMERLVPRHPSQLYESISCLVLFFMLYAIYLKKKAFIPEGRLLGIFLIYVFGLRFFYEFIKENQVAFEEGMTLNMGQLLSIPLVLAGIWLLYRSYANPKLPAHAK